MFQVVQFVLSNLQKLFLEISNISSVVTAKIWLEK